ncbi:MAG: ABC transporter six-transmembrane domain-containing protein [Henriciella sp.]|nr:ABC transporter six-transmembrane domain-containing protein [Henriciella sp.]
MQNRDVLAQDNDTALGALKQRTLPIAFTYTLSFFENLFELAYPWAIGLAINGLIIGQTNLVWPLVAIWLAHIAVGAFRQLYDTRLFSRLNALMGTKTVRDQRKDGVSVSEITTRVEMIDELIEFLEHEMPFLLAMIVGLVGSLVFLALYDLGSGLVMLALMVPILIINAVTGMRAYRNNVALNSQWEKQVEVISDHRPRRWHVHFGRLARWRIRLSDLDATSWSLAQLFTLVAVIIVIYRAATGDGVMAGDVFAVLSYALRVEHNLDGVPSFVQQVGRLIDIRRRIQSTR